MTQQRMRLNLEPFERMRDRQKANGGALQIQITAVQKVDTVKVARLAAELWEHPVEELAEEFAALSERSDAALFSAKHADTVIGFAQCQLRHDYVEGTSSSPVGYLEGIFVEKAYRNQGVATALLQSCEAWARTKGCAEFASDCELTNAESLGFHLAVGFEEANRIVCFRKRLSQDDAHAQELQCSNITYRRIGASELDALWELQTAYKAEIGEDAPTAQDRERLRAAMECGQILFYGAWDAVALVGCCSVTVGFSTFLYAPSGVFEDFFVRPAYRHKGIARKLVQLARADSGVSSLTVGCADCDLPMYQALGFSVPLGKLLAFDETEGTL